MIRKVGVTLLAQIVAAACTLLASVALARGLGPADRGTAYILTVVPAIVVTAVSMGLPNAFVYRIAGDPQRTSEAWGVANLTMAVTTVAVLSVAGIWILTVGRTASGEQILELSGSVMLIPVLLYVQLLYGLLIAVGDVSARGWGLILQSIVYTASVVAFIALGVGPAAAALSQMLGGIVATGVAHRILRRRARIGICRERAVLRTYIGFGMRGQAGVFAQMLNYRLDALILSVLAGNSALGVYAVATNVGETGTYIANAAALALFRDVADEGGLRRVPFACRMTTAATAVFALAAAPAGIIGIPLVFGSDFAGAITPFVLLLPGMVALAVVKVLSMANTAAGRPDYMSIATVAGLAMTVILDLLLIPALAASGAAIASTLAYATAAIASVMLYRRIRRDSIRSLLVIGIADISAVAMRLRISVGRPMRP